MGLKIVIIGYIKLVYFNIFGVVQSMMIVLRIRDFLKISIVASPPEARNRYL